MKHFLGGWALSTILSTWCLWEKSKTGLGNCLLTSAVSIGILGGIAAWGLIP